jgi:deoxycytidylate deaminase
MNALSSKKHNRIFQRLIVTSSIPKIKFPEFFFGIVAPIGADTSPALNALRTFFKSMGYAVIEIKVTDIFRVFETYLAAETPLKSAPLHERYQTHISYGNQLRKKFGDDCLATSAIGRIVRKRLRLEQNRKNDDQTNSGQYEKTVYILDQFKRKEEIDLLRAVYGELFFQISIYSRRGSRVDYLSRKFANSQNSAAANQYRQFAEAIIERDENEVDVDNGQRVGKIFHDADLIISLDDIHNSPDAQIHRFCKLLFGSNSISPTRFEYGLFLAKAAALRTLDLSRQVGAAIFSDAGEIIALGSNEVPKAGGGTYWAEDKTDAREYKRRFDSNDERKKEILSEIVYAIDPNINVNKILSEPSIINSHFMDALEYGRIVHAEMSAISDAARLGNATKGASLFCTTFPCHMCAKHIVAAGIDEVIFLEPYPKSLASELHCDSVEIEGSDRGIYRDYRSVKFSHFYGITPRRYNTLFARNKRKDQNGFFLEYKNNEESPIIDIKLPLYIQIEEIVLNNAAEMLEHVITQQDNEEL